MRCDYCQNYLSSLGRCKFCHFEYEESVIKDDWDILDLDEDDGWEHEQILNRLHSKGIDCISADIWFNKNMAYLMGCFSDTALIADALGLHEESVYGNLDNGLVILNLYQEKHIRWSEKVEELCLPKRLVMAEKDMDEWIK